MGSDTSKVISFAAPPTYVWHNELRFPLPPDKTSPRSIETATCTKHKVELRRRPRRVVGGLWVGRRGYRSRRSAGCRSAHFWCRGSVRLRSAGCVVCGGLQPPVDLRSRYRAAACPPRRRVCRPCALSG